MEENRKMVENSSRLTLIDRLCQNRPSSGRYRMVIPRAERQISELVGPSGMRHLEDVLNRKSLMFAVVDKEGKPKASFVCKLDDKGRYTYEMKGKDDDSELRTYERECVEYAVKNLMIRNRVRSADLNEAHSSYNSLGCCAIRA